MSIVSTGIIAGFFSLLFAYFVTPFVIKFAKKIDIIDDPKKNKHPKVIHKKPIPRGGGLGIYISVIVSMLVFLPLNKYSISIMVGSGIVVVTGIIDDKYNLSPYLRLAIQFLAASIPIIAGIGIAFISNPMGGVIDLSRPRLSFTLFGELKNVWILSDLFALFWIVFLMNMLNMGAKGIQGQLSGVTAIAAITISILSLQFASDITQWPVIILAMITAGAFLGFLPWNFFPQKIMPGWSGSTLAGFLLAVLSILATTKVGVLLVVLGVPIVDTLYTMTRRVLSGKSPVWGDRGHLHHKLLDAGLTERQVVYFYWSATAFLGALAINLNTSSKLYTIVGVTTVIGALLLCLTFYTKQRE